MCGIFRNLQDVRTSAPLQLNCFVCKNLSDKVLNQCWRTVFQGLLMSCLSFFKRNLTNLVSWTKLAFNLVNTFERRKSTMQTLANMLSHTITLFFACTTSVRLKLTFATPAAAGVPGAPKQGVSAAVSGAVGSKPACAYGPASQNAPRS